MMKLIRCSVGPGARRRSGRTRRGYVVFFAVLFGMFALVAPNALAARSVNFVGTWTQSGGVGWTITHENRRTGACVGKSALAKQGYGLVACRVRGNHYSFTITYGSGYKSVNTGTVKGNSLIGSFHDSNGTIESYTATRARRRVRKS
jgi:hypothetical protein